MLKIGVTGGIGAGKSVVCKVFSLLGIPVYDADSMAKTVMDTNKTLQKMLQSVFGTDIISDGIPDRKALARIVFDDQEALDKLNAIVHPEVHRNFLSWLEKHRHHPYIIKEAAIMFESGAHAMLDFVILITAPEELRMRRIMSRDGGTEESIRKRMERQWPDEKKIPLAEMVIRNDNTRMLVPAILKLHSDFSCGSIPGTR
jgi:dephospho-CoA kinase